MKLEDKDMAGDVLSMIKHDIEEHTKAALECSNVRLRQTLRRMRDQAERAQDEIAQIAMTNQWYLPSSAADHSDCQRVENFYAAGATPRVQAGAGPVRAGVRPGPEPGEPPLG